MAGIRDSISASSSSRVNFANLILRVFQVIFGIVVVGFYASMYGSPLNKSLAAGRDFTLQDKLTLGVVAGCLSIITAVAFALLPALVSYYYVAIAFIWEWVLFFIWCALFGWFRASFGQFINQDDGDVTKIAQMTWVDLINMLLWLATALMSIVCLLADRKSLRVGRSGV